MKVLSICLVVVFFISYSLKAQEDVWTLERCIDYALENNLDIKRQELGTALSDKDYKQSYYNILPDLGAGVEHQLSSGRTLVIEDYEWKNKETQQGSMGLSSGMTLFSGLQNYNQIQQNKFLFLKSKEDLETIKNERILMLAAYYLNILFAEELLQVSESQLEVTLLEVEKNKKLVEVGNAAKSELLAIQALAANDKLNVTSAKNTLQLAVLDLVQLLDLDSIGNFQIYKPDMEVELLEKPGNVTEIYEEALSFLPQIKSAEYMVKAQEKDVAIQQGSRSPEVYLDGLYYTRYLKDAISPDDPYWTDPDNLTPLPYDYPDQLKNNQYKQLSLGLRIPIFSKMQTQTNISKAKITLEDYNLSLEQQKQILYKTIQQNHADAIAAFAKYTSALEAVNSNEEAFKYTQQKFDVGLVNSVDFNVAKNNLTKARSDLAQAKFEYIFKVKILEFYTGKPIRL